MFILYIIGIISGIIATVFNIQDWKTSFRCKVFTILMPICVIINACGLYLYYIG
jgi:type III secretory pathway component EscS